jgi:hypothetical protein
MGLIFKLYRNTSLPFAWVVLRNFHRTHLVASHRLSAHIRASPSVAACLHASFGVESLTRPHGWRVSSSSHQRVLIARMPARAKFRLAQRDADHTRPAGQPIGGRHRLPSFS